MISKIQKKPLASIALIAIASTAGLSPAATISTQIFTNNADSGISSSNIYTHKLDFAASAPGIATTVNSVIFDHFDNGDDGTLGFSYNGGGDSQNNGTSSSVANAPVTGAVGGLLQGFLHQNGSNAGFDRVQTMTLTGLTAGTQYDLRIYNGRWGNDGVDRTNIFTFDPDGAGPISDVSTVFDQNDARSVGLSENDAWYINYRYTAVAGENLVVTSQIKNTQGASWHLYALTNQVVPIPETSSLTLCGIAGIGLIIRRRR